VARQEAVTMNYPQGWDCERTCTELERYLALTIEWDAALAVAEHLEACVACAEHAAVLRIRVVSTAPISGPAGGRL
jgi:hypothetical protein